MDTEYFMADLGSFKILFKKAEPFIAIGIFVVLIIIGILLFREQGLKRDISENCGWGEDDYYCYCEKGQAMEVKNKMDSSGLGSLNVDGLEFDNVSLGG